MVNLANIEWDDELEAAADVAFETAPELTEETKTNEQSQPQQHGNKRSQTRARRRTPGQADTASRAEDV